MIKRCWKVDSRQTTKDLVLDNQNEESLIAQRLVKDFTRACYSSDLSQFPVSKGFIVSGYKVGKSFRIEQHFK